MRLKSTHLNFGDVLYPKFHFIQLNNTRKTYVLIWEKCNIRRLIVFCEYLEILKKLIMCWIKHCYVSRLIRGDWYWVHVFLQ